MTAQTGVWVVIAVIVVVALAAAVFVISRRRRSQQLKDRFGPEYDRTVGTAGGTQAAETELESRKQRREQFEIRPLSAQTVANYSEKWKQVQVHFVDAPADALREADVLLSEVMRERGYPGRTSSSVQQTSRWITRL